VTSHIVAVAGEIPPGTKRLVSVNGREIGVFNVDGSFYAVRNLCPHQSGPLCAGLQVGKLDSMMPGEYEHSPNGEIIQCPWHQWEFDVSTGQSWCDPSRVRARSFAARVEPGEALTTAAGPEGKVPGPYVAEVYPVSVEQDYVVIEIG
jgi:3-phenylpropionate/trans-cinnamate dioxygenase ferredoxin subunit